METYVFLAVLGAAALHAGWNALVHGGADRMTAMLLLSVGQGVICLPMVFLFPAPQPEAMPWLLLSVLLHTGYKLFLIAAYRAGDLSQVYPLARGTAPLIVTVGGALFLGELLPLKDAAAVLLIGLGVIAMSMKGGALGRMPAPAIAFALATACMTAGYTLSDGFGARLSGSVAGYAVWLFLLDAALMGGVVALWRGVGVFRAAPAAWGGGFLAGGMSLASYWVAIWAFTKAPIALVGALRETSVLFAMLISVLILKERSGFWRWTAAGMILSGVILLRA